MKKRILVAITALFTLSSLIVMAQPPQGGGRPEQPSPEEQVEKMKSELDLSEEQCEQVLAIQTAISASQKEMMSSGGRPDRDAMEALMTKQKTEMAEVLTEKQYKKWEKLISSQRGGGRERQ